MYPMNVQDLHVFQHLLAGTWSNDGVLRADGVTPYSYNVMPLPQQAPEAGYSGVHGGYILKNFRYTETISFHSNNNVPEGADIVAIPAGAPNRGFEDRQVPRAIFYDQIVKFSEGPLRDTEVHIENGAWLYLQRHAIVNGPYPNPSEGAPLPQPDGVPDYAKQISVPHGNSILALGKYMGFSTEALIIPQGSGLPTEIDVTRFRTELDNNNDYENPHVPETKDPLMPLRDAIDNLVPTAYHHVSFSTRIKSEGLTGVVANIPFEETRAAATDYEAHYWLFSTDECHEHFDYLAYFQNITLRLKIGEVDVLFPHVTSNVVKRQR